MTAFCTLCGNTEPGDLGTTIGICLNAEACHRRQARMREHRQYVAEQIAREIEGIICTPEAACGDLDCRQALADAATARNIGGVTAPDPSPGSREGGEAAGVTRWRKKPVTVEAVRWTGANVDAVLEFCGGGYFGTVAPEDRDPDPDMTAEVYDKLHGTWVHVYDGQWIIRGVQGEFYPISAEVLAATYERAGSPPPVAAALDADSPLPGMESLEPVPAGTPAAITEPPESLGEVLHRAREAGNAARIRPLIPEDWADRDPRLKELDEAMAAAVAAAAVAAERERIGQLAIRSHAVCIDEEGGSIYFAALIGEPEERADGKEPS